MNKQIDYIKEYDNLIVITNGELSDNHTNDNFEVVSVKADNDKISNYYSKALKNDIKPGEEVIFIKQKQSTDEKLQVVYVYEGDKKTNEHIIIVNNKFSKLNLVENRISIDVKSHQVYSIVEVFVGDESSFDYIVFNDLCEGVESKIHRYSKVMRNAVYNCAFAELSEGNTIADNYTSLAETGSSCDSKVVTIVKGDKVQKFDINITHDAKNTSSNNLNRAVVDEDGSAIFNAIGFIAKGFNQSKCHQDSKMLTLSENAKSECNPILLIDEYDVEASHAAAVGQLDEESLYYLQSRGLSKQQCEKLLIYGFLMPVAEVIESEDLKEKFISNITKKLNL